MTRALAFMLLAGALAAAPETRAGERQRLKEYLAPDSSIVARIFTRMGDGGRNAESSVEFRRRSDRRLIGAKSFMSKDRQHGFGVLQARWSIDGNYFVFSMVSSGGHYAGEFPTFVFSRRATKIVLLDAVLRAAIASPEFAMQAPDRLTVTVRDTLSRGGTGERTIELSKLRGL